MSYYRTRRGERGEGTDAFRREPTGYLAMAGQRSGARYQDLGYRTGTPSTAPTTAPTTKTGTYEKQRYGTSGYLGLAGQNQQTVDATHQNQQLLIQVAPPPPLPTPEPVVYPPSVIAEPVPVTPVVVPPLPTTIETITSGGDVLQIQTAAPPPPADYRGVHHAVPPDPNLRLVVVPPGPRPPPPAGPKPPPVDTVLARASARLEQMTGVKARTLALGAGILAGLYLVTRRRS
jgi:hypothetical protein